jgi:hypothetical protein
VIDKPWPAWWEAFIPERDVCAACGHLRTEHCNCGKECFWHGPLKRMPDGKQEYDGSCACAGFKTKEKP